MLSETTVGNLLVERLKLFLPARMQESCIPMPDKPELITADVVKAKHPDGLLAAGYSESEGPGGTEVQLYAVDCLAQSVERCETLVAFCKMVIVGWQIPGATRFEFHYNNLKAQEYGIIVRRVHFRCIVPAVKVPDSRLNEEIAKLNL